MKIIAVDDEKLQLETLVEFISEIYPEARVAGFSKVSDVLDYIETNTVDVAILDIDLPGNINGINLGAILRGRDRRVKLLYCSGYSSYAMDAFKMHANGYLQKPIMKEELRRELDYVLRMPVFDEPAKPYIHTFGNFDLFVGNRPVIFRRNKSKEILAYLTDREGGWVSNKELAVALWEDAVVDTALSKYITTLTRSLIMDLERVGAQHILDRQHGRVRLLRSEVLCDYYSCLEGDPRARARFHNEYMKQYSWGEGTLASLMKKG